MQAGAAFLGAGVVGEQDPLVNVHGQRPAVQGD